MTTTRKSKFEKRKGAMVQERSDFIGHWKELSSNISPRAARFFVEDRNKGGSRNSKIINSASTMALRTFSTGLMAGASSPSRPWFRLASPDPGMMEFEPVKVWLNQVETLMREIFSQSNLYNVLPTSYADLGLFATSAFTIVEDFEDVIRCVPHAAGSFMIANNQRLDVDVLYREYQMTASQIVAQFVFNGNPNAKPDWSNVSTRVRTAWDSGNTETWFTIVHAIEPNDGRVIESEASKDKRFRSVYYESGGNEDKFLRESGFDEFPGITPRWDVTGEDIYGTNCPGMTALGDTKALQILEKRKGQGVAKAFNPPLSGPSSLRGLPVSSLAGGLTIYDEGVNKTRLTSLYDVPNPSAVMGNMIQDHEQRIDRAFYVDLFLAISSMEGVQPRNIMELVERKEEKLLQLGPALDRLHKEGLSKVIDRTFSIMVKNNLLPPAPEELQGQPLKVEYISMLAQAQRAVAVGSLDRMAQYIGGLAQFNPDVVDKFDFDQSVDEYGEAIGVSPKIIRSDDKVKEMRGDRQRQQQMQQALAMAGPAADAAKALSETNVGEDETALSRLTG